MPKSILELLSSKGLTREDLVEEAGVVSKSFLSVVTKESLSSISAEEYKSLLSDNKMLSDGSDIENEEDRQKYLDGLTQDQKDFEVLWKDRIITIRGSDETADRHNDIVKVDGWQLDNFKKNPVFLSQHNAWETPVGKAVRVWKEYDDQGAPGNKSLMFRIYFPTKAASEQADETFRAYKSGLLSSVSVGFRGLKAYIPDTEAEREALGMKGWGVVFLEQELFELSAVSIPANQNAQVVKTVDESVKEELLGLIKSLQDKVETLEKELKELSENVTFKTAGTNQPEQEQPVVEKSLVDLLHAGFTTQGA